MELPGSEEPEEVAVVVLAFGEVVGLQMGAQGLEAERLGWRQVSHESGCRDVHLVIIMIIQKTIWVTNFLWYLGFEQTIL